MENYCLNCAAPPPPQFSKHVFGFSKLGFVLDSSQPANLVNCPRCLESYFLNSAVVPPPSTGSTAWTPPGASGGLGRPPGALWGLLGTSGGLCGARGTICPAPAPKTVSAGARWPNGAVVRPRRAPICSKIIIVPLGSSASPGIKSFFQMYNLPIKQR